MKKSSYHARVRAGIRGALWSSPFCKTLAIATLFLLCNALSCHSGSKTNSPEAEEPPDDPSQVFDGVASWYGGKFHGRKTANGERYDKNKMTCAHRSLAFGTMVRVINKATRRAVILRVNDRGPFGNKGRIIDVSEAAARELGFVDRGVATVRVEVLSVPDPALTRPYSLLAAARTPQQEYATMLRCSLSSIRSRARLATSALSTM